MSDPQPPQQRELPALPQWNSRLRFSAQKPCGDAAPPASARKTPGLGGPRRVPVPTGKTPAAAKAPDAAGAPAAAPEADKTPTACLFAKFESLSLFTPATHRAAPDGGGSAAPSDPAAAARGRSVAFASPAVLTYTPAGAEGAGGAPAGGEGTPLWSNAGHTPYSLEGGAQGGGCVREAGADGADAPGVRIELFTSTIGDAPEGQPAAAATPPPRLGAPQSPPVAAAGDAGDSPPVADGDGGAGEPEEQRGGGAPATPAAAGGGFGGFGAAAAGGGTPTLLPAQRAGCGSPPVAGGAAPGPFGALAAPTPKSALRQPARVPVGPKPPLELRSLLEDAAAVAGSAPAAALGSCDVLSPVRPRRQLAHALGAGDSVLTPVRRSVRKAAAAAPGGGRPASAKLGAGGGGTQQARPGPGEASIVSFGRDVDQALVRRRQPGAMQSTLCGRSLGAPGAPLRPRAARQAAPRASDGRRLRLGVRAAASTEPPALEEQPVVDAVEAQKAEISAMLNRPYKYGFKTFIESETFPKGLSEDVVAAISAKKEEPAWLLEFRLRAYRKWLTMAEPAWSDNVHPAIDFQDLSYYSAPKIKEKKASLDEVDPELLATFDKLGIPINEQKRLANVAVDAVFDSVSIATTFKAELAKAGVIFCSISEAVKEYPDLVRKHMGSVVPVGDNYYAALNSAVFSDGSFVYVPKGVRSPMELSTYFRINASETGQFERTLIIAEDDAYVSYLEGCTAPAYDSNQLHAAVVELSAGARAEIKYSTVQNWYAGDAEGRGGIYNFVTKRGLCAGERSKISWTQVETGSAITWKYPSVVLKGDHSVGEFYSVALTNHKQQADTGTKMVHVGKGTRSRIVSKGISAGGSVNAYRGLVSIAPTATGARNYSQCDSMLIGDQAGANTYPYIQVREPSAVVEHEASTSKIGEDQLFYFQQRGVAPEAAVGMIISGFCREVFNELPLERSRNPPTMPLAGGLVTRRPLCFSSDGRLLLAPCGADIRVYSARSGDQLATLRGHAAEVTAVVQEPGGARTFLSASLDGTLRQWDVEEGTNTATWTVGEPIESMVYSKPAGLAYVSVHYKRGQSGRVVPFALPSGEEAPGRVKTSRAGRLVLSPSGAHVGAIDRNSLFVWPAAPPPGGAARRAKPLNLAHTKPYTVRATPRRASASARAARRDAAAADARPPRPPRPPQCAAFDAHDGAVAAGDATGRILIWHNLPAALAAAAAAAAAGDADGGAPRLPPATTVHWHAHAVGALAFTLDGSHLLSGGQEGVLVQWSLPAAKRTYLPRLGGPLCGITPSAADPRAARPAHTAPPPPRSFCVAQSDNTLRVVNTAAMAVELSIHGLRPPPPAAPLAAAGYGAACAAAASSPGGVVLAPRSGQLVLPADHAMLQWFDPARGRHVARLQTEASTNYALAAAAGVAGPPPLAPSVVLLAFTFDGDCLVTVDVRPATGAYGGAAESTLRFWDATGAGAAPAGGAPYVLNTSADAPHRGAITGLAAHPRSRAVVTTGSEGEYRSWAHAPARRGAGGGGGAQRGHWRCAAVGGYRGQPLGGAAFSADGSLLAVAAGGTATLWDPEQHALVAALPAPAGAGGAGAALVKLVFMRRTPHLVGLLSGGDPAPALAAVGLGGGGGGGAAAGAASSRGARARQAALAGAVSGAWGSGVVVWDLLACAPTWFCSLPVCSLAADPARPLFAVGVPALPVGGGEPDGDQQQAGEEQQQAQQEGAGEQQQQQGGRAQGGRQRGGAVVQQREGLVLVFGAADPQPLAACPVPGGSPASLIFTPGGAPPGAGGAAGAGGVALSPLLLLTDDRRYTHVALGGGGDGDANGAGAAGEGGAPADGAPAGTRAAMEAELAAGADESALEAMFGRAAAPPAGAAAAAPGGGAAAAADAAAVKAAVAALFDAPSHALPAPTALCPTLLELLIGAGRR
ncbi:ycf24 [Scenedesmus sp. PABB004]|nr:ycf24 [Scenedesmus sp. PABB004]